MIEHLFDIVQTQAADGARSGVPSADLRDRHLGRGGRTIPPVVLT
jgi:hypothetical protein